MGKKTFESIKKELCKLKKISGSEELLGLVSI